MKTRALQAIFFLTVSLFLFGFAKSYTIFGSYVESGECLSIENSVACGTKITWNPAFILNYDSVISNKNLSSFKLVFVQDPYMYKIGYSESKSTIFVFKSETIVTKPDMTTQTVIDLKNPWGYEWDCSKSGTKYECNYTERRISSENLALVCEKVAPTENLQNCALIEEAGQGLPKDVCSGSGCSASPGTLASYSYFHGNKVDIQKIKNSLKKTKAEKVTLKINEKEVTLKIKGKKVTFNKTKQVLSINSLDFTLKQAKSKVQYVLNGSTMEINIATNSLTRRNSSGVHTSKNSYPK